MATPLEWQIRPVGNLVGEMKLHSYQFVLGVRSGHRIAGLVILAFCWVHLRGRAGLSHGKIDSIRTRPAAKTNHGRTNRTLIDCDTYCRLGRCGRRQGGCALSLAAPSCLDNGAGLADSLAVADGSGVAGLAHRDRRNG